MITQTMKLVVGPTTNSLVTFGWANLMGGAGWAMSGMAGGGTIELVTNTGENSFYRTEVKLP